MGKRKAAGTRAAGARRAAGAKDFAGFGDQSENLTQEQLEEAFGDGSEEGVVAGVEDVADGSLAEPSSPEPPPVAEGEPEGEQPDAQEEGAPAQEQPGEEPAVGAEGAVEEHPEDGTTAESERTWAGKFKTPEELERSYELLQSMETRTRQQAIDAQTRGAQLEEALRQAYPLLQEYDQIKGQLAQQRQGEQAEELDTMDPASIQSYIQQQIQQGIQQFVQQAQGQNGGQPYPYGAQPAVPSQPNVGWQDPNQIAWQQQFEARKMSAIDGFRKAHPEVVEGSAYDQEMYRVVETYNLDPSDPEQLEMGWDIWQNPQAGSLLRANPHWLATPEGRDLFRQNVRQAAPKGAPAAGGTPARPRPQAHVETGGTGAPVQAAPGERPGDFDPLTGKPRDIFSDVSDLVVKHSRGEKNIYGF